MATKPIVTGTRMSVAEFLDLPDTEEREKMELDDGELYIMPRPAICPPVSGYEDCPVHCQLSGQLR